MKISTDVRGGTGTAGGVAAGAGAPCEYEIRHGGLCRSHHRPG